MKKTIILVSALISMSAYSQVGINTETPKATLDVVGKPTHATAVDGVIIPRITGNELKAKDALYEADQTGTIIYATAAASPTTVKTAEITAAGFYYFNGSIWKSTAGTVTTDTNIYNSNGTVTAGANRTVTIPDATNVNFNGVDGGSFYAWTDSGDIGLFGYQDFGKISLATEGANADIKISTTGTDSNVLLQSDSADKNVGIGSILPTAKLHTNGTVRLEGLANSTTNNSYLTTDSNGNVTSTAIPTDQWKLLGNAATTPGTNLIGTTDDEDFVLKRNNLQAGLLSDDTLAFNAAFGTAGLPLSSTGTQNSSFGALSLGKNTTGNDNSAFGSNASLENTVGTGNSSFGANTLKANLGNQNSAFGSSTLALNTTGEGNSAFGRRSMPVNTTGSFNSSFGGINLDVNTTGSSNSILGSENGWSNTTGSFNSIMGGTNFSSNTTGSRNTGVGSDVFQDSVTGNDNVEIGFQPMYNTVSSSNNVAVGNSALRNLSTGTNNTAFGYSSGNVTTGSNNIAIGNGAQVPTATASNQIRMGNTDITSARVQVAWSVTSDQRWKTDIKNSDLGLNFIQQLRPVSYIRKNDDSKKLEYGFIAQELQETLKKNGVENSGMVTEDEKGMLSVRYNDLFAPLVKSIQEQQESLERDQERLNQIQAKLIALEKK